MIFKALEKYWKALMWIPLILLVISVGILAFNVQQTGSIMKRDVELVGGKMIIIESDADIQKIKEILPYANVRATSGLTKNIIVEIPYDRDEKTAIDEIKKIAEVKSEPAVRTVGPALGSIFFQQAMVALIAAFIMMSIVVFVIFRSAAPSTIVILAALTDIVVTMALLSLMNVSLSLPVFAALLTLIGYSVDTDILLTSELLKSGEEKNKSIRQAMKTGLTMTFTTLAALLAMYVFSGSYVIEQIAIVLIVGLIVDIFATWLTNAGVLRWYLERKEKKGIR